MPRRVALIGMNNPLSGDGRNALAPQPVNCAGWRLWQMLRERTGATQSDYLKAFQRVSLGDARMWNTYEAERNWMIVEKDLLENFDTIVILGAAVRRAAGLILPSFYVSRSLCCVPHPSGRNRWYNDPRNKQMVEVLLEELYTEAADIDQRSQASPDSLSRVSIGYDNDMAPLS